MSIVDCNGIWIIDNYFTITLSMHVDNLQIIVEISVLNCWRIVWQKTKSMGVVV